MGDTNGSDSLVSQFEFANRAHVNRSSVSRAIRSGVLKDAVIGKKINVHHPDAICYIELQREKQAVKTDLAVAAPVQPDQPTQPAAVDTDSQSVDESVGDSADCEAALAALAGLRHMTIGQAIAKFGTEARMKNYVVLMGKLIEIETRGEKQRRERGELIERSFVSSVLIPLIDTTYRQLVSVVPDSLAIELVAIAKRGDEDCLGDMRTLISERISKPMTELITNMEKEIGNSATATRSE